MPILMLASPFEPFPHLSATLTLFDYDTSMCLFRFTMGFPPWKDSSFRSKVSRILIPPSG